MVSRTRLRGFSKNGAYVCVSKHRHESLVALESITKVSQATTNESSLFNKKQTDSDHWTMSKTSANPKQRDSISLHQSEAKTEVRKENMEYVWTLNARKIKLKPKKTKLLGKMDGGALSIINPTGRSSPELRETESSSVRKRHLLFLHRCLRSWFKSSEHMFIPFSLIFSVDPLS